MRRPAPSPTITITGDPEFRERLTAAIAVAVRTGISEALSWQAFDRQAAAYPAIAVRGASDDAWVKAQMAKRAAYIRRIAGEYGLDPDEATRRWRDGSLALPEGR